MPPSSDLSMPPFMDIEAIQTALNQTAIALQARFAQETGECYCVEDLQQALTHWLELSIEELVDDALFHTVEGDRAYAFNRRAFELQMQRLQPLPHPTAAKTLETAMAA
ncbi:MAG TPA: hypothetical protein V6C57_28810 [Coleofasciculaceae cyanobacterium]